MSQTELGEALGVPQTTIALWEQSEKSPRSDVLPKMAKILGVEAAELLVGPSPEPATTRPVGRFQRIIGELRTLPRRQQERILDVVAALLEQSKAEMPSKKARRRS